MVFLRKIMLAGLISLVVFCVAAPAWAILPPEVYARKARMSKIKAVAVVEAVKVMEETKRSTHKKVVFRLERAFSPQTPQTFSGTCYSVDRKWQNPGVGGTIYYYPTKGQRVLVTVSTDGGPITSFTPITSDLAAELDASGLANIIFVMGRAKIQKAPEKKPPTGSTSTTNCSR